MIDFMITEIRNTFEYGGYYGRMYFEFIFLVFCLGIIFFMGYYIAKYLDELKDQKIQRIKSMRKSEKDI